MTKKEQGMKIGEIISKAWADEAFKQRLLADTATVLAEEGIEIPEGVTIKAVENTDTCFHLVIPPKQMPTSLDMSELAAIAGGGSGRIITCDHTEGDKCYK
jgi:hypothetical protein